MLLHQPAVRTKLGSIHICYFVTNSPYHPSQLPHLRTLRYFCSYIASHVSHKTIKVYLSSTRLEHLECGHHDPTNDDLLRLVCKGTKRSQGNTSRPRLPVTINVLKVLKIQLRNSSYYSLVEKRLLWSAFTLAFYAFLRAGEFTDSSLQWSNVQSSPTTVTIHLRQSKTDPLRRGQFIILQATSTSICPVRAMKLFTDLITTRTGPLYCGGRFNPLSREQLTRALCMFLQFAAAFLCQPHFPNRRCNHGCSCRPPSMADKSHEAMVLVTHTRHIYSVQPAHFKLYHVYFPELMLPNSHRGTLIPTKP